MAKFRIPRVVKLPGMEIEVKRSKMSDAFGMWDDSTNTITLDTSLTEDQARYVLLHELVHAMNDHLHMCLHLNICKTTGGKV